MERERGEIGNLATHLASSHGTKGMSCITHHRHPSDGFLNIVGGNEQGTLAFYSLKYPVVVADNAAQVNRNDHLGAFGDGRLHLVVVHLQTIGLCVDDFEGGTHMHHHTGGGCISVGRGNDLIPGAYTNQS